jgi:hypothetical protein
MGNVCCGGGDERPKPSAVVPGAADAGTITTLMDATTAATVAGSTEAAAVGSSPLSPPGTSGTGTTDEHNLDDEKGQARRKDQQQQEEEQARLLEKGHLLVQQAARAMVAVRSTRADRQYYRYDDQGFAAALGQHLEQTTQFTVPPPVLPRAPPPLPGAVPLSLDGHGSSSNNHNNTATPTTVYARLGQPPWTDLLLGPSSSSSSDAGLAGCAGEHPETYLDRVAESFLEQVVPQKERLFAKVEPIVESLL